MRKDNTNFSMIREELEKLDVIVIMLLALLVLRDPLEEEEVEVEEDHQELKILLKKPKKNNNQQPPNDSIRNIFIQYIPPFLLINYSYLYPKNTKNNNL